MFKKYKQILISLIGAIILTALTFYIFHNTTPLYCTLFFSNGAVLQEVPVATTPSQHQLGLSGKKSIGVGMLFQFSKPEHLRFWMRNTFVPLSVGFFSSNGILMQIENMEPNTDDFHVSKALALMALELPQGEFERLRLVVGNQLVKYICS